MIDDDNFVPPEWALRVFQNSNRGIAVVAIDTQIVKYTNNTGSYYGMEVGQPVLKNVPPEYYIESMRARMEREARGYTSVHTVKILTQSGKLATVRFEAFTIDTNYLIVTFWPCADEPDLLNPTDLSIAEQRVATMVRDGLKSRQIADALYISKRTVENHRANIRKKLAIPPKASLAKALQEYNL